MILPETVSSEPKNWYILDKDGDIAIRIKSGIKLGELTDGTLALADKTKAHQWIRLYVNADGELWLTVINSHYVLQAKDKVRLHHYQLKAGARIQLPNNQFTISDRPFLCEADEMLIRVKAQQKKRVEKPAESMSKSQLAKDKLMADIDKIFPDGKFGENHHAAHAIRSEPEFNRMSAEGVEPDLPVGSVQHQEISENKVFINYRSAALLLLGVGAVLLKLYSGY
jgi:hypothetical protein